MSQPVTTLAGIVALFDGDAALTADFAGSGGLWVGGVPEDRSSLPIAALINFREVPEWNTEGDVVQDTATWDLVVYGVGLASTEALASRIKAVFDPGKDSGGGFVELPLDPGTATAAWVERQDYTVTLTNERAADSSWVYEAKLSYKSTVARRI